MDELVPENLPAVRTQSDLDALWRTLMGPLGFGYPRLYVVFIPPDGRCIPHITEVGDLPDLPDSLMIRNLLGICATLLDRTLPMGSRVAFLHARPGRRGISPADRAWGAALLAAADDAFVPVWPVHLANDHELRVLTPDDLAEPA
jgi:hypothetical protein